MKKFLTGTLIGITALAATGFLFRESLVAVAKDSLTSDMFIGADTDGFDAGLAVGSQLPSIKALHQGKVVTDLGEFIADKGMIFIANRSVDW